MGAIWAAMPTGRSLTFGDQHWRQMLMDRLGVACCQPGARCQKRRADGHACGVLLDPSIMVAAISMVVLEGWQYRLDPAVSIFHCPEAATGGGVFGTLQKASALYQSVVGRLTGEKAAA